MGRDTCSQGNLYDEEYFDKLDSLSWARKHNFFSRYEKQFLELLSSCKNDIVIDVGCGTGWHINLYGDKCSLVVGIDLSKKGIKRAAQRLKERNKYTNVSLIVADVNKLPLSSDSANKILCINLIEHLIRPSWFLSETNRVLRKNGKIIIGTRNRWDPLSRALEFLGKRLQKRMPLTGYADETHIHLFNLREIKSLLSSCNFKTTSVRVQYSLLGMRTFGGDLVVGAVKTVKAQF